MLPEFGEVRPSKTKCCVPDCEDRYSSRFRFPNPKNRKMLEKWLININNPKLTNFSYQELYKKFRVCARHFPDEFLVQGFRRGVRFDALPILHLSSETQETEGVVLRLSRLCPVRTMFCGYRGRYSRCIVPGCDDKFSKRHTFPRKDLALFDKWIDQIRNPILNTKTHEQIYKAYRICDVHFSQHDRVCTHRGLTRTAFPTEHLPPHPTLIDSMPDDSPDAKKPEPSLSNPIAKGSILLRELLRDQPLLKCSPHELPEEVPVIGNVPTQEISVWLDEPEYVEIIEEKPIIKDEEHVPETLEIDLGLPSIKIEDSRNSPIIFSSSDVIIGGDENVITCYSQNFTHFN